MTSISMYSFERKTKFKQDMKRIQKRGWDLHQITKVLQLLLTDGELPEHYQPHPLIGKYKGCMDAHIRADWVIVYQVIETEKVVILQRTGSHQDIFSNY